MGVSVSMPMLISGRHHITLASVSSTLQQFQAQAAIATSLRERFTLSLAHSPNFTGGVDESRRVDFFSISNTL